MDRGKGGRENYAQSLKRIYMHFDHHSEIMRAEALPYMSYLAKKYYLYIRISV